MERPVTTKMLNGKTAKQVFPSLHDDLQIPVIACLGQDKADEIINLPTASEPAWQVLDQIAAQLEMGWGMLGGKLIFFQINSTYPSSKDDVLSYSHLNRIRSFLRLWFSLPNEYRDRLSQGQFLNVGALSKENLALLNGMIKKEGLTASPPKTGVITISIGNLFNLAAAKKEETGGIQETTQFRYYLSDESQVAQLEDINNGNSWFAPPGDSDKGKSKPVLAETQRSPLDVSHCLYGVQYPKGENLSADAKLDMWDNLEGILSKTGFKKNIKVDPRLSNFLFFSSSNGLVQTEVVAAMIAANNAEIKKIGNYWLLQPHSNPVDDIETEAWVAWTLNSRVKPTSFIYPEAGDWVGGQFMDRNNLNDTQKQLMSFVEEHTTAEAKKKFVSDPSVRIRLSSGAFLRLAYYATTSDEQEDTRRPTLELLNQTNLPLYWDWEDVVDNSSELKLTS